MTFDDLVDFIKNRMRMSHIYQPLLIKTLVRSGGSATLRQLAQEFLAKDESQLLYYEKRIKEMPVAVLSNHEVIKKDGNLIVLNTSHLDYVQKSQIEMLCESKIQEFVQKKGLGIWDYRMLEGDPIPDSIRYTVLRASGGRCALCGVTSKERLLDVDHIIPRSRGGGNNLENLQVLCSKCNRSKGNKDDTDFRESVEPKADIDCPFCSPEIIERAIEKHESVFAVEDLYPVTDNHILIIPYRHTPDYFTMTERERQDSTDLLRVLRNRISEHDRCVSGFNVGINCGEVAGQTVMHAHLHLIPRRRGDTDSPRGGVRGVIPARMGY